MSDVTDILRGFVIEAAKEALKYAAAKVRDKVKKAAIAVDDKAIEIMLLAELTALDVTMRAMKTSIDVDLATLEEAERKFRNSPNVTVVDSMDEPHKEPIE